MPVLRPTLQMSRLRPASRRRVTAQSATADVLPDTVCKLYINAMLCRMTPYWYVAWCLGVGRDGTCGLLAHVGCITPGMEIATNAPLHHPNSSHHSWGLSEALLVNGSQPLPQ